MTWTTLQPANAGGGRKRGTPAARLAASGVFSLNHAAADLMPLDAVRISRDAAALALLITPTAPGGSATWSFYGGGNAQHRVRLNALVARHPQFVGSYSVELVPSGLLCVHADAPAAPAAPAAYNWRLIVPTTARVFGARAGVPATLHADGTLALSGASVEALGPVTEYVVVQVRDHVIRLLPTADPAAHRLSGAGTTQRRVMLRAWGGGVVGEYKFRKISGGIELWPAK